MEYTTVPRPNHIELMASFVITHTIESCFEPVHHFEANRNTVQSSWAISKLPSGQNLRLRSLDWRWIGNVPKDPVCDSYRLRMFRTCLGVTLHPISAL